MYSDWNIKIIDRGFKEARDVYIFRDLGNGKREFVGAGEVDIDNTKDSPAPSIELGPEQLQALADELDKVGYKPQKGFVEGRLLATEYHLKDMRKLLKLK